MDSAVKLHTQGRYICGKNAEVESDTFKFIGNARRSVGVVKILEPVTPMLNYFEIKIVDKGNRTTIGLGFGEYKYPLDRMPGWNRNGIGYHADDGRLFHQDGFGRAFGPVCTTGDRMGCGAEFDPDLGTGYVNIFFTKNGVQVGQPVKMKRPIYGLYPLIGLHSEGEIVNYLGHWRMVPHLVSEPMETENSPSVYWLRSNGIRFVEDSLTLEYDGEGLDKQDVGIAQANFRLTPSYHYFELEILDAGKEGWIAIGLAKTTYSLMKHPGWSAGGVGYHADNGHIYKEKGQGDPFGPTCTKGDMMGCGIRFPNSSDGDKVTSSPGEATIISDINYVCNSSDDEDHNDLQYDPFFGYEEGDYYDDYDDYDSDNEDLFGRYLRRSIVPQGKFGLERPPKSSESHTCTVYFTKNGELVGESECNVPSGGFYPIVAMLSPGEKIRVNLNPLTG